jgi:putative ABC transport system ATP-binding protein
MESNLIKLENVWKIYQMGDVQVPALKGIDLEVQKGEFLVIAGASGSGKSTMMNLIGCLDLPSDGKIFLGGDDIAGFGQPDSHTNRFGECYAASGVPGC